MRICIPTESSNGFDARVHAHFGSAPIFTIFETETKRLEVVNNPNHQHLHGTCRPLNALGGSRVDIVVCGGMGARAVQKLNQGGIKAYLARGDTVQEVLGHYDAGELKEITVRNSCKQHACR